MTVEANQERQEIRQAVDNARRYREATTRLAAQLATIEAQPPTPANKKHAREVRRLHQRNEDLANTWETKEQELNK